MLNQEGGISQLLITATRRKRESKIPWAEQGHLCNAKVQVSNISKKGLLEDCNKGKILTQLMEYVKLYRNDEDSLYASLTEDAFLVLHGSHSSVSLCFPMGHFGNSLDSCI